MSTAQLTIVIFSVVLVLLPLASSRNVYSVGKKRNKINVVVEGMVYCQNCKFIGSSSLTHAHPMASANVSVICNNHRGHISYQKTFETDGKGYFFAQLKGFAAKDSILEHPLQACIVKLASSPLPHCNILSNINNGVNGAPFKYVKELRGPYYDAALYKVAPLAFRPNQCPRKKPLY